MIEMETLARDSVCAIYTGNSAPQSACRTGWDAAMRYIKQQHEEMLLSQADGRYCNHRDDDPAHSLTCYQQGL